jgi:hypothetical protein
MTDADFIAWLKKPDSIRCALVEVGVLVSGVEQTYYLSSQNFVSKDTDTPPTQPYTACITGGVAFTEKLNLDGQFEPSYGDIQIDNSAGIRDAWLDPATYVWTNRQIQVYMGDVRWARADFRKVFDGVVGDILTSGAETLNLHLLDKLQRLNAPISETELGGGSDNKDKLIPLCFGECFNVEPLLITATRQYKVHTGAIESFIEVRSNGVVPVNLSASSLPNARFTLADNPASTVITASVQGAKDAGGTYLTTIAAIVAEIAKSYGPTASLLTDDDLDLVQLAAFDGAYTQGVGLYVQDRMNKLDACQQLAGSVGAQVVMTTLGLLRLVPITLSGLGTPADVTDEDFEHKSLHISQRTVVKAACKLAYCKNWSPLQAPAASLSPRSGANYKQEWWYVTSTDATTQTNYKLDVQPQPEETLLIVDTEAQTEADRRRDLWKVPRHVYTATYFAHMLLTELGDPITITHDRFGLGSGKTGIALEIERDWLAGRVTIGVLA